MTVLPIAQWNWRPCPEWRRCWQRVQILFDLRMVANSLLDADSSARIFGEMLLDQSLLQLVFEISDVPAGLVKLFF